MAEIRRQLSPTDEAWQRKWTFPFEDRRTLTLCAMASESPAGFDRPTSCRWSATGPPRNGSASVPLSGRGGGEHGRGGGRPLAS